MSIGFCVHCGTAGNERTCRQCGAPLPLASATDPSVAPERFAQARMSERYAHLQQLTPSAAGATTSFIVGLAFLALWIAAALGMTLAFQRGGGPAVLPAVMAAAGAVAFVWLFDRWRTFSGAPLERRLFVVRDTRIEVRDSGPRTNRRHVTQHVLLCEGPDGQRAEFECGAQVAALVARGDLGVAFVRAGSLLAFERC